MSKFSWKICIIGNEKIGKTSLLNRFVNNKFQDSYQETVGIDMFNHDVVINYKNNTKIEISLLIYDFGGQKYWKSIRSSFYQKTRGIILVYDVENIESFEALESWHYEALEQIGNAVPFILIGNKSDLKNKIGKDLLNAFLTKYKLKHFETSAKTGEMVLTAFQQICEEIYENFNSEEKNS